PPSRKKPPAVPASVNKSHAAARTMFCVTSTATAQRPVHKATSQNSSAWVSIIRVLVPKLGLGTPFAKLCFVSASETEFRVVRSQTEFGNQKTASQLELDRRLIFARCQVPGTKRPHRHPRRRSHGLHDHPGEQPKTADRQQDLDDGADEWHWCRQQLPEAN